MLLSLALALAPLSFSGQLNDPASLPTAPKILWTVDAKTSTPPAVGPEGLCLRGPRLSLVDVETGAAKAEVPAGEGRVWTWVQRANDNTWLATAMRTSGSGGTRLARFSADLGTELWSVEGGAGWFRGRAITDKLVIGNNDDGLVARRLKSGAIAWKSPVVGQVLMTPGVDQERVFVGTTSGSMLAFALEDGHLLWSHESGSQFAWTDPVPWNGLVFIGDRGIGGGMRSADTGKQADDVDGPRAGALNAFDAKTGELKWSTIFGATGFSRPFVDADTDTVWAGFGRSVAGFDIATGELLLDQRIATGSNAFGTPRVIGERVAFGNLDGHFYVHDRASRELLWALHNPGEQVYGWTATGGKLFVAMQGRVVCVGQDPEAKGPVPRGTVIELEQRDKPEVAAGQASRAGMSSGSSASGGMTAKARLVTNRTGRTTRSAGWIESLHALGKRGDEERPRALAELTGALGSSSVTERAEALHALLASGDVAFDKTGLLVRLRELAGPGVIAGDATERIAALSALGSLGREDTDLALVLDLWPELAVPDRWQLARLLAIFSGMDLRSGPAAERMLELVQNAKATGFDRSMGAVWGATVSDAIAEAFIELSRSSDTTLAHNAIYFGLSTFMEKSPATVERLIEVLEDPDWNNSGRALWGLSYGVPPVSKDRVVDAMLDLYEHRSSTKVRERSAAIIRDYGGEDRLDALLERLGG